MNDAIAEVSTRKQDIMPLVRFERMAVEDHVESLRVGRYMAKDVDYVIITPPYSKDEVVKKVKNFLEDNQRKVQNRQMPASAAERYEQEYQGWLKGQELPPDGTPIRGWAMISPAQSAMLIDRKILTVELLSTVNDEGLRLIGMGGHELRAMAKSWLAQAKSKGPLTMEVTELQKENAVLKGSVDTLTQQVEALRAMVEHTPRVGPMNEAVVAPSMQITPQDLNDEPDPPTRPNRKR